MVKQDFETVKGIIHSQDGQEFRFKSAKDLTEAILRISETGDSVEEIILKGKAPASEAYFKLWADEKRPNWGCVQVNENTLNTSLSSKLDEIRKILDT